jgi:hypothetical protein
VHIAICVEPFKHQIRVLVLADARVKCRTEIPLGLLDPLHVPLVEPLERVRDPALLL